jgi:hypothetical protein
MNDVNDLVHAALFLAETLVMCVVLVYAARVRRSARATEANAKAARTSAFAAELAADRAEAVAPPDVIPFPADKVRGDEIPAPDVISAPAVLKLFRSMPYHDSRDSGSD